jgi:hypothetical protein
LAAQENFSQAVQHLLAHSPDRVALEDHLRKLQLRGCGAAGALANKLLV